MITIPLIKSPNIALRPKNKIGISKMQTSIVFHAAELERCKSIFNNINNLIKENDIRLNSETHLGELIIHVTFNGDSVKSLMTSPLNSSNSMISWEEMLPHATLLACENSLRSAKITQDMLPDYIQTIPSGVYSLIAHQKEGFYYIRP